MSDSPPKKQRWWREKSALHDTQEEMMVMNRVKIFQLSRALETNIFFQLQDIDASQKQKNDVGLQMLHLHFFTDVVSSANAIAN